MNKNRFFMILGIVLLVIYMYGDGVEVAYAQVSDDFIGPEGCESCHVAQYEDWEESGHADAYSNSAFQEQWESEGSPDSCLECHTTGYDSSSGEYASEGVSCESCHGAGLAMEVDTSSELCASCHSGELGMNRYEDYLKGTHANSGVTCADCHVSPEEHTFELVSTACASCHTGERIHSSGIIGEMQARALSAEEIAEQVQEEHDALLEELSDTEQRSQDIVTMVYIGTGALFVVGLIVAVLYLRQKQA
jgi:hypothetical protein